MLGHTLIAIQANGLETFALSYFQIHSTYFKTQHIYIIYNVTHRNYEWWATGITPVLYIGLDKKKLSMAFNSMDVLRPDFCLMDLDILNIHTKTNSISNDGGEITLKSYAV